ncbi:FAD-binding protein [Novosphingobium resinovorum]|uniref:FAD-binding protein n=1 Tax=Novosphingobium TaxID=165696 RepID=UPI001B3C8A58|nr:MULTISPECIES: FAD-binding protein [Novosphingobium]MBF7013723.1 FAD-binding protein [Novosphingobium sp. HR1a]WJM25867.1 FAD-binding protein [Novosphingobium resinovorum]
MTISNTNFVVVGSGAAGLVGAITAHRAGLRPIIIEKADVWGGTTATSGGVLWVPNNHLMADGKDDTPEAARQYVLSLIGEDADDRAIKKAEAFLAHVGPMAEFLAEEGVAWKVNRDHPDYYPDVPGSSRGRTLESEVIDGKALGQRFDTMRMHDLDMPAIDSEGLASLTRAWRGPGLLLNAAKVALSHKVSTLLGRKPLGLGRALVASLMALVDRLGIPVHLSTGLVDLVVENGAVVGVIVEHDGARSRMEAPAGVLLAAGGFSRNAALRKELQGAERSWPNAIPEDQGDALQAARAVGAATELLEGRWWMPSIQVSPAQMGLALGLRALPGSMIVDARGRRYMNEAANYMTAGRTMFDHGAADERHWLVMDDRFLRRYIFAELSNKVVRKRMMDYGFLLRAGTVEELARQCGMDPAILHGQVKRFNGFAATGEDLDFHRGASEYDRHWADPDQRPNPSLGRIDKGPFWAALIRPGDLGSNGGIKTNDLGQVLAHEDRPIHGLYAAGNSAGSPFRYTYPGAGATIAAAGTFAFIAARHAASRSTN